LIVFHTRKFKPIFVGLVQVAILVGSLFPIVGSVEVRQFVLGINRAEVNVHCGNRLHPVSEKVNGNFELFLTTQTAGKRHLDRFDRDN
jgi:hypothetical protein